MRGYRANAGGGPWTSFFVAVLFLLLFPLFPLGAELLFTQRITMSSMLLVTATYATSLSMSSRHVGRWALSFTIGFVFSTLFGWSMGVGDGRLGPVVRLQTGPVAHPGWLWFSAVAIAIVFGMHVYERYERHVADADPFPEFVGR